MSPATIAALIFLVAAGAALSAGESAVVESRDFAGAYWLFAGAVAVRASLVLAEKRRS
jgi:hypothetical protein